MSKKAKKIINKNFTLVEVVVAMLVLSIGLMVNFSLISSVSSRVVKSKDEWRYQHMITQAAEYYMLYAKEMDGKPDSVFFPYEDFSASSEHLEDNEVLPEDIETEKNGWKFVPMQIKLLNENNEMVQSITIDRILYESDL